MRVATRPTAFEKELVLKEIQQLCYRGIHALHTICNTRKYLSVFTVGSFGAKGRPSTARRMALFLGTLGSDRTALNISLPYCRNICLICFESGYTLDSIYTNVMIRLEQ